MPSINRVFLATLEFKFRVPHEDRYLVAERQMVFTRQSVAREFYYAITQHAALDVLPFSPGDEHGEQGRWELEGVTLKGVQTLTLYRGDMDDVMVRMAEQYGEDEYANVVYSEHEDEDVPAPVAEEDNYADALHEAVTAFDEVWRLHKEGYHSSLPEDDADNEDADHADEIEMLATSRQRGVAHRTVHDRDFVALTLPTPNQDEQSHDTDESDSADARSIRLADDQFNAILDELRGIRSSLRTVNNRMRSS